MRRTLSVIGVVVSLGVLAAACGGSDAEPPTW